MNNLFIAGVTEAFGRNHLIVLAACIIVIIAAVFFIKKKKISFEIITNIMLCVWILSEVSKLLTSMSYLLSDGTVVEIINYVEVEGVEIVRAFYPRSELPFHLCSIQPLFILTAKLTKNIKIKETLLSFIFPTGTIGALIALVVSTVGGEINTIRFWEYFIFHTVLIIYAISIVLTKQITINLKSHFRTCGMLIVMFLVSIWINALCSDTSLSHVVNGVESDLLYTNFFFSLKPPMDGLPLLNFNYGWFGYLAAIMIIGLSAITLLHLPFIIINWKREKLLKN